MYANLREQNKRTRNKKSTHGTQHSTTFVDNLIVIIVVGFANKSLNNLLFQEQNHTKNKATMLQFDCLHSKKTDDDAFSFFDDVLLATYFSCKKCSYVCLLCSKNG